MKLVAELMSEEDFDMDRLRDYKDSLEKVQYSDAGAKLQNFYEDLMAAQNGHLAIFAA